MVGVVGMGVVMGAVVGGESVRWAGHCCWGGFVFFLVPLLSLCLSSSQAYPHFF
jgi:hypothetical protein